VTSKKLLPETMGSGVAVLDFDRDGKPDLLFINSRPWPGQGKGEAPTLALYRNLGDGRFADVTKAAGLDVSLFGMGVTIGDIDNDGWPDIFITGVGGNRLFRNEAAPAGGGAAGRRFRDITVSARVGGPGGWPKGGVPDIFAWKKPLCWSTSAAFLDYDGDGWLDLFVCNYVAWSPGGDAEKGFSMGPRRERAYGPPRAFGGTQCFLYRNRRDGTFENVSREVGIEVSHKGEPVGKSLGVIVCDVDDDGWPDIVVANDTERNFFFHNVLGSDGQRRFSEIGEGVGVAYADRSTRGAMGVDWGPTYRQGQNALLIGNFADEPDTFLVQQRPPDLHLIDRAAVEGIAGPSRPLLKFGLFFFDFDLDGRLDFLTCNGHLEPDISRAQPDQIYAQPAQLFWNRGEQLPRFALVPSSAAGPDLFQPVVGRGCAFLDIDSDGALDTVLTANGGPARLLRNENRTGNHWIRLRLEGDGKRSNRDAIGARVVLEAGGREQRREVSSARGYLSQSELTLTFGLGKTEQVDRVTIHWPGKNAGPPTVRTNLEVDTEHHIQQEK